MGRSKGQCHAHRLTFAHALIYRIYSHTIRSIHDSIKILRLPAVAKPYIPHKGIRKKHCHKSAYSTGSDNHSSPWSARLCAKGSIYRMHSHRHRLEHSCLRKAHLIRKLKEVFPGNRYTLRKTAIAARAQVVITAAQFKIPLPARLTFPTGNQGIYAISFTICLAAKFMTYDKRHMMSPCLVGTWYVRTAYTTCSHREYNLTLFCNRLRRLCHPYIAYIL